MKKKIPTFDSVGKNLNENRMTKKANIESLLHSIENAHRIQYIRTTSHIYMLRESFSVMCSLSLSYFILKETQSMTKKDSIDAHPLYRTLCL